MLVQETRWRVWSLPEVLDSSAQFAKEGGKLVKLEFPKTEIQLFGYTAVLYSNFSYELEIGGQHSNHSGRVTEVFVLRKGQWVNPGWHMESGNVQLVQAWFPYLRDSTRISLRRLTSESRKPSHFIAKP